MCIEMLNKIHPFTIFICFISLIIMIIVAKSLYLILFLTSFILYIMLSLDINIKDYLKVLLTYKVELIIFFIIYILLFKIFNFIDIIYLLYKLIIILFLIMIFISSITFVDLNLIIYYLFYPLKKTKINIENMSYDCSMSLYLIKKFFESKNQLLFIRKNLYKKNPNIIDRFSSRVVYSIGEIYKFSDSLKLSFYKITKQKLNLKSKIISLLFVILLIISIIKEVIL